MSIFKETKLKKVLNWIPNIKRIKPVDIGVNAIKTGKRYPFYGQSVLNNGIIDYISLDDKFLNNKENNIYLLVASNNHSINIVNKPFYIKEDHAATSTIGHVKMTLRSALYIKSSIYHSFDEMFDYNAKATQDILKNTVVTLPFVNKYDNELDWEYMENHIQTIEDDYLNRITKHLKDMNYSTQDDTKISTEDKRILEESLNIKFKPFKLCELFDVITRGKRIRAMDRENGDLPFITAGVEKMGFSSFIGNKEAEIFPKNSLTIDMFGNTFYRGYKYGADDHVAILYHSKNIYSKKVLQYMQPCINKSIEGKFSYSRNFYASDAMEVEIDLPVNAFSELDVIFIEKYMSIIEKKVVGLFWEK